MILDIEKEELASELRGSLLRFTQYFYPLLTARDFIISNPHGRESHHITICKALTQAARLQIPSQRLLINVSPGSGKSTLLSMWVAWTLSQYPDSRYLYISYSKVLAAKHTETIKRIVQLPHYKYLFDVHIRHDSKAKDSWQTTAGGAVSAFGSTGAITGQDAGLPNLDRFSGAAIMDDMHKPDEVFSDTMREGVIDNYKDTVQQRMRGINVPLIFLGQRLHEGDLANYLLEGKDGYDWHKVILKSIDDAGNAMYPEVHPIEMLRIKQERDPYVFASQFQQDPIPAGGALFKPHWIVLTPEEPEIIMTFLCCDTAETAKSYNDATVFSFFGIYEIENFGKKTGEFGIHWLDCVELRIEPKDLKDNFIEFWSGCMTHSTPPLMAAIEKKSTGVTLISVLEEIRGIQIRQIERTRASGSKTQRFLEIQPYIAGRRVSITEGAKHQELCLTHMSKITANNTHRHDDVCYVRGSKIATTRGYVNIEDITFSHKIITPLGIGSVTACGSTGYHRVIKNINLEGTPNHPIYSCNSFKQLDSVTDNDIINKLSFKELFRWRYKKLLYSMELNIDSWDRNAIILVNQKKLLSEKILKDFMLQFGNFILKIQFLKGLSFIIKTMITLIITLKIWSVFHAHNILKTIKKIGIDGLKVMKPKNILIKLKSWLKHGIAVLKESIGIETTLKPVLINYVNLPARYVKQTLEPELSMQNIAPKPVITSNMQEERVKKEELKEVFNLTVETYGVYYVNNILVSNCDTLADAIKIALIDKTLQYKTRQNTEIAGTIMSKQKNTARLRGNVYGNQQGSI